MRTDHHADDLHFSGRNPIRSILACASGLILCATAGVALAGPIKADWNHLDTRSKGWVTGADHVWSDDASGDEAQIEAFPLNHPEGVLVELSALIGEAVSGAHGYDAVNTAPHIVLTLPPPAPLTTMTLAEINDWIATSPDPDHAIGNFQLPPKTLCSLQERLGLSGDVVFDKASQGKMAHLTYVDAGLSDYLDGRTSLDQFMDNLAVTWPSLPGLDDLSLTHVQTDHRATVSRSDFAEAMRSIFDHDTLTGSWASAAFRLKPRVSGGARFVHPLHLKGLGDLVSRAESPQLGYDAVIRPRPGRPFIQPPRRPTAMTLGDIYTWVEATPNQDHAIGRYQIIPKTLRQLQERLRLPNATRFDAATQDRMALALYEDAALIAFLDGAVSLAHFQDNLAIIWAGLPLQDGRSAYRGFDGNKATISSADFDAEMRAIFSAVHGGGS